MMKDDGTVADYLWERSSLIVLQFDQDGHVTFANHYARKLLGEDFVGRPFGDLLVDFSHQFDMDQFRRDAGVSRMLNFSIAAGLPETLRVTCFTNDHGGIVIAEHDLAELQEWRTSVLDLNQRLGNLSRELQKKNAELQKTHEKLEAANIELEAFNSTVSHDLRKPLTVINSYCQVIQELSGNSLDDECKGYIREMYEGTLRMNRLIDTLINFSHVTRIEMHREPIELSKLAEEVVLGLKLAEPERRVTSKIAAGITADADADLLRVVLENLIGNAWKHTVSREETVIEFGVTEVEGKPACFVRDNGPGFDMAVADKLFIPFQRLPGTKVEGHGIGLATVERIVRRHGGQVWAEGTPGMGATFFFTLDGLGICHSRSDSERESRSTAKLT